jgi:predicted DNA binding CopG/RHH family protein
MKKAKATELDDDPLAGDLSEYLGTLKWRRVRFVLAPKNSTVTLRIPSSLLELAKKVAKKKGIKYHRMMRDAIVDYVVKAA